MSKVQSQASFSPGASVKVRRTLFGEDFLIRGVVAYISQINEVVVDTKYGGRLFAEVRDVFSDDETEQQNRGEQ